MPSTPDSAQEMAGWSRRELRDWADGLNDSHAPRDINWWLQARWAAQQHAYNAGLTDDARRGWADVFLLLVDCMQRFTIYDPWVAAADRFHVRAHLIRELGQVDGSTTWNADSLAHDVLAMLTLSPSEACEETRKWRSLPTDQVRTLRQHKNVLTALESVADLMGQPAYVDLAREWLALRPHLP
jgi:hypothetical protein